MKTHTLPRLATLTAGIIILSACQSIPKAKKDPIVAYPQIATNDPYPIIDANSISSAILPSVAAQRWQDFYNDARLKQLIALGLENNKDIHATILALQRSRAAYQITDIKDIPTIGASATATRSGNFEGDAANRFNVGLAMSSYEFDFWGRIASLKDAALQNYLATGAAKDAAQISLVSNIAQNYVAYSYNLAQLQLAQRTLATRQESLRINQLRFKAGLDSELTSVQAQSLVENANIAIATAKTNLLKNINALQYLLGTPVPPSLLPPAGIASITNNQRFSAGLPSDLLRYRPDIRQAEHNLKAAGANINAARAAFYPTISLSGNVGTASADLSNLFKSGSFSWGFGPTVSLPIFDAGARRANYQISEIDQNIALNSYEKSIQAAFKEVSDVFATRATLNEQQKAYANMKIASDKNYKIADARFKAGLDNYLGVLDAERGQYSAAQSLLNIEQQRLLSQIQLYQVLGGGVNFDIPLEMPTPYTTLNEKAPTVGTARNTNTAIHTKTVPAATPTPLTKTVTTTVITPTTTAKP